MKHALVLLALLLGMSSSIGYGAAPNAMPFASIKIYKDIPGVTGEEIAAIEALKAGRDHFSYGTLRTTEAFILPDGSYAGFAVKLCKLLSELFEIRFAHKIYAWDELIHSLESRGIDFTGELALTEERRQKYDMTFPIAERMLRIFTRADTKKIQTTADLDERKIGFLTGSIVEDAIRKAYHLSFTAVDIDNLQMAAKMLENGEIDAFVSHAVTDPFFESYDLIRSAIFFPMVYKGAAIATANPELAPVISVLNKYIAAGGIDKLYALYKEGDFEYSKYKLEREFTNEERAYIRELLERKTTVGVAFEHDNYPISFYDERDKAFQGIAVDVLAEISKLTGLRFEAVTTKNNTWAEILEKTKAGEIRMVAQLLTSEAKGEHLLWSAAPYSRTYYAMLSKTAYPNLASYQLVRTTVGIVKQFGPGNVYRELFPDNDNIKEYDTLEKSLDALERGDVELLAGSEHTLLALTHYREKSGFKVNLKLRDPMDSYFGFARDEHILCSIINKAQQYVQTDMIEINWTGRIFDHSKKLAEERAFFLTVFVSILLLMLLVTIFILIKNVLLGRKLKGMANIDALTGIFNRRCFLELCTVELTRSLRSGRECFIIIFDLDHFKAINDTYGHVAGDEVLIETARRVKKIIRPYDLFGRHGGEEFILLMPDLDRTSVRQIADRIRLDLYKAPIEFEGRKIPISASFGIACTAPMNDVHAAIRCADTALYQAKREGRNRVVFQHHEDCA